MESKSKVEVYLEDLLGKNSRDFIREFLLRWTAVVEERRCHGNQETMVAHTRPAEEELVLFEAKKTSSKKPKKVSRASCDCQSRD